MAAGGDTATLLMGRVRTALEGKDIDLAIKLLTAIIDIKPDYVEGWNRRATIYFMQRDFGSAIVRSPQRARRASRGISVPGRASA